MNNSFILQAKDISKTFRFGKQELAVLKSINLTLPMGSSLSICGESGCGKTTLLNILARIENADNGTLLWGDRSMNCEHKARPDEVAHRANFLGSCLPSILSCARIECFRKCYSVGKNFWKS